MTNSEKLIKILTELGLTIFTAESCTGGLIAKKLTDIPGASKVVNGGIVSYNNQIKMQLLGVRTDTLQAHSAVSAETAQEMAMGAVKYADIGISVTGYASPCPGEETGLVYIGVAFGSQSIAYENHFEGSREEIRDDAAERALEIVLEMLGM